MDDNTLAAQYAKTGNLLDLCHNEAWLRESAQIENQAGGRVEAGLTMQGYCRAVNAVTVDESQQLRQQMRVQSIVFTQLQQWMESWNLGAAFDETYTIARRLIRVHLAHPTPAQQTLIETLLTSDAQVVKPDEPVQQQIIAVLLEMLTQEDWQTIATAASQSIAERVLTKQAQAETTIV